MDKNKQYLVAVSGGPDSMALLDILYNQGFLLSVAHINYHKRESALRDQIIVEEYCDKHHIPFYLKEYDLKEKGNFQDNARVFRYKFFNSIINKNNLEGVFVGHQEDDVLETYLMQKERKAIVDYYGIKEENEILGVKVIRPLLSYTKKDLEKYCQENNISYGIDESNLSYHYSRNKIRHEIVEKLNKQDRINLIKEIETKNIELQDRRDKASKYLNNRNKLFLDEFNNYFDKEELLRQFIGEDISSSCLDDLLKQIKNSHKIIRTIKDKYFVKEYGYIEIFKKPETYSFKYEEIKKDKKKYFKITDHGDNFVSCTVKDDDYPITIRNYKDGDSIKLRYGTKRISRYFIDNKISFRRRLSYPVVLNKNNEIILVPGIGANSTHFSDNNNLFVIE